LVPNQFTGKNWIVEPADLGKRVLIEDRHAIPLTG
jgi:hypothetical protein